MPTAAPQVKLFAAILHRQAADLERALPLLAEALAPIAYRGPAIPVTHSTYYDA